MARVLRVLMVERSQADAALIEDVLTRAGTVVEAQRVSSRADYLAALSRAPDLVLSDFALPDLPALEALSVLRETGSDIPFIIVSEAIGEDVALDAVRSGVTDCVLKHRLERLPRAVTQALAEYESRSDRKLHDFALLESEQRYRALVEQASDAFFTIDASGHCLHVNQRGLELFGCERAQLFGKSLVDLIGEEDYGRVVHEVERLLAGDVCVSEWKLRTMDGRILDVEISARQLSDGSFLAIVRDFSARRKAEAQLRDERERFTQVAAMAPSVIVSIRMERSGRVSLAYASPRLRELFPFDAQIVSQDVGALARAFHPDDLAHVLQSVYVSRDTLSAWCEEFRVLHPERGEIWVEGRANPVREADCGVTWHGVVTDITERKRNERVVRDRLLLEERLSRLAVSAPGAMHVFKLAKDGGWSLPFASPQVEEILGFSYAALSGDLWLALSRVHVDDLRQLRLVMEASLRDMDVAAGLFRYEHPTLGRRWIEVRSMPSRDSGGVVLWHGFFLDATDRVELEEQLRQSQKMDAFGQLASGVAHDFNNLLTIIQGNAGMLFDATWSEHGEYLREIVAATKRASSLTRQLLLFSRRQPIQPVDLDLGEVVERMTKMLKPIVGEEVLLETALANNLPLVHADPGMIEQILLNLTINARDAMPGGGKVVVSTGMQMVDEEYKRHRPDARIGASVRLSVKDSGSGIPPEIQARIFEPFFTTKEVGKGTGLGLATVHGIVKQHRGWVELDSKVGEGATFHIYLPIVASVREQPRRTATVPPRDMPGGNETILVVEDEMAVRIFVTKVLRRCGYSVLTAPSARAALDVWREKKSQIKLLFTDMVMPDGMTGRELADSLTAEDPNLKVVFTSGYSPEWAAKGFVLAETVNFLQKPYEPQKLAETVRNCLDRVA